MLLSELSRTVREQRGGSASKDQECACGEYPEGGGRAQSFNPSLPGPGRSTVRKASDTCFEWRQETGLGEGEIRNGAEQGVTGSRPGEVWNLGVGWQRPEILTRYGNTGTGV